MITSSLTPDWARRTISANSGGSAMLAGWMARAAGALVESSAEGAGALESAELAACSMADTRQRPIAIANRSEEHTSELQSLAYLVCRLLLEKKKRSHKTEYAR